MNKAQLVEEVAEQLGGRGAAARAVDAVLDTIVRQVVAGNRVTVTGFGTFEKRPRKARYARNLHTGERVTVEATEVPRFRAGVGFKRLVSGAKPLPVTGPAVRKAPKGSVAARKAAALAAEKAAPKLSAKEKAALKRKLRDDALRTAAAADIAAQRAAKRTSAKAAV